MILGRGGASRMKYPPSFFIPDTSSVSSQVQLTARIFTPGGGVLMFSVAGALLLPDCLINS